MITIYPHTAFLLYLFSSFFALFLFWLFDHLKKRRHSLRLLQKPSLVHTCEYCQKRYLIMKIEAPSKCPSCGLWNERKKNQ